MLIHCPALDALQSADYIVECNLNLTMVGDHGQFLPGRLLAQFDRAINDIGSRIRQNPVMISMTGNTHNNSDRS